MKTFLHVGCGLKNKTTFTTEFGSADWDEIRLDINPDVVPDIVGTMTDMGAVDDESVDAIFSSHNIEHLYAHDVPLACSEFLRVLKEDGFLIVTCPDLESVCALIAQNKLTDEAYVSPAGPITPLDILFGHRKSIMEGNHFMAHKCGFTRKVLTATLINAGFKTVIARRREYPAYDLWAMASKIKISEVESQQIATKHFPR
jgi:predicted SAM-dependent methyltransferase